VRTSEGAADPFGPTAPDSSVTVNVYVNTPVPEIGGEGVAAVLVKPPPTSAHA
jgi:hypothetical protein